MTTDDDLNVTTAAIYRSTLDRARAVIESTSEGEPLRLRAEKLVADVEGYLAGKAEAATTADAAGGVDALQRNAAALDSIGRTFRDKRNAYEAALAEGEGARYSDAYRAELLAEYDAGQQSEAENLAKAAWVSYQRAEDAGRQDMQAA